MKSVTKNFQIISTDTAASPPAELPQAPLSAASQEVGQLQKEGPSQRSSSKPDAGEQNEQKLVSKQQLINRINYINFQDETLVVNFHHTRFDKIIALHAKPQPCLGDLLDCQWVDANGFRQIIQSYEFQSFFLTHGSTLWVVEPELIRLDEKGISLLLPETGFEFRSRKTKRHTCKGVKAQFSQHGSVFYGALLDFNALSFRIELRTGPRQTFDWINPELPVNLILSGGRQAFYSGECKIVRQTPGQKTRNLVLTPLRHEIHRFRHKEHRSERQELNPSPEIIFRHPFTKNKFHLKALNLSGSGLAVEEDESNAVLVPGLLLPELELSFAKRFRIKCQAQVVYRRVVDDGPKRSWVKCGLALLDMDLHDHISLIGLLDQAKNPNSYLCNDVDLNDLWDFFFETGFIYPDKYAFIQQNKAQIKETYAKLYTCSPHIARHFIYQEKGRILGHMAMLRFYQNTWLIHHHAARKSAATRAGLIVLDQIGRMCNDSHRLYSLHMDYMICYYRPDNKFPNRVFGGAAKSINDPSGCSIDCFAYFHYHKDFNSDARLADPWEVTAIQTEDFDELESYYTHTSGGLMLNALDLKPELVQCRELTAEYQRLGLTRERHLFALKCHGRLKALFVADISDLGLNLSDLTNCIKVVVLDHEGLPGAILSSALYAVMDRIQQKLMPVLLYPMAYADRQRIKYDKLYNLWVCSLDYSDQYFSYLKRLLRFI
ncbi:MAG: hypothetical protein JSW39_16805 [Desulfobacterales bacterium]|nr:MAG: hypothetical protein JSW39_16805 [Desulfobacterales bacterium]